MSVDRRAQLKILAAGGLMLASQLPWGSVESANPEQQGKQSPTPQVTSVVCNTENPVNVTPNINIANPGRSNRESQQLAGYQIFRDVLGSYQEFLDNSSRVWVISQAPSRRLALGSGGLLSQSDFKNGSYQPYRGVGHLDLNNPTGLMTNDKGTTLAIGNKVLYENGFAYSAQGRIYAHNDFCPQGTDYSVNLPDSPAYILDGIRLGSSRFMIEYTSPFTRSGLAVVEEFPTGRYESHPIFNTPIYRLKATTETTQGSLHKASVIGIGELGENHYTQNAGVVRYDIDLNERRVVGSSLTHLDWNINDLALSINPYSPGQPEAFYGLDSLRGNIYVSFEATNNEYQIDYQTSLNKYLSELYGTSTDSFMYKIMVTEDRIWLAGAMAIFHDSGSRLAQSKDGWRSLIPFSPRDAQTKLMDRSRKAQGGQQNSNIEFRLVIASLNRFIQAPTSQDLTVNIIGTDPTYQVLRGFSQQDLSFSSTNGSWGVDAVVVDKGPVRIETDSFGNQDYQLNGALYPTRGVASPNITLPLVTR